jgi:uncharacterized protein YdiU (UPF0061 family)
LVDETSALGGEHDVRERLHNIAAATQAGAHLDTGGEREIACRGNLNTGAEAGDLAFLHRLQAALQQPFTDTPGNQDLADFPPDWAADIAISCSS